MKVTMEFNLPEEASELNMAKKGGSYYCCLWNLDQKCRGFLKYGHEFRTPEEALQYIRDFIGSQIDFDKAD